MDMNSSNGSYRAPPVRRWMSDLVNQVIEVLGNHHNYTLGNTIDPEISKKILSIMPEATSVADRQEAALLRRNSRGFNLDSGGGTVYKERKGVDTSSRASLSNVGNKEEEELIADEITIDTVSDSEEEEEEEVEVDTVSAVYDAELAAILSHYQTSKAPVEEKNVKLGNTETEAMTENPSFQAIQRKVNEDHIDLSIKTEQHLSSYSSSPNSNWRPKIGEGSLFLLIRLIADSSTPQAALQVYKILDTAAYPTRTPRFLGSMVDLLVRKNQLEAAAALLREVILTENEAEATATATEGSSSSCTHSPSLGVLTYRGGSSSSGKYSGIGTGKFSGAWAALSRSGHPEIVQGLIEDLERAGIPPDTDAYVCSIRAYAHARDTPAAMAWFEEMRQHGIQRTSSVFASLAGAAADDGDVELALKVLYWAEEDAKDDSSLKLTSVWRELLKLSCSEDVDPGLVRWIFFINISQIHYILFVF